MQKKIIFLDFDGVYRFSPPKDDIVIVTNKYDAQWVVNVNKEIASRNYIYDEFKQYCDLISSLPNIGELDIGKDKIYMFNYLFFPLGQWIEVLKVLFLSQNANNTEIVFSSYAENSKVFVFEAEGETNAQFLYKKSYFLSYYIKQFIFNEGFDNVRVLKNFTFQAKVSFYLRGIFVLSFKTLQLLLYKIFVRKRYYSNDKLGPSEQPVLAVLSRGVIQSQFIEGLYKIKSQNLLMIINESSSKPFRNLKVARGIFEGFFYAEGFITIRQLLSEFKLALKPYFSSKNNLIGYFYGVKVDFNMLLPEIGIKTFHLRTYSHSVKNALQLCKKEREVIKLISFEMLPPFAYYLKRMTSHSVFQIQSAEIASWVYPNFVYGDGFYFSNNKILKVQRLVNHENSDKFNVLHNLKYIGLGRTNLKKELKILTYFTQPIYFDEEERLILFLAEFCKLCGFEFQIKLHPRSPMPTYLDEKVKLIDGNTSSYDAILNSDITVTRNSSVGFDSWYANVPVLFFVNETLTRDNISYIPNDYLGAIITKISVEDLQSNLDEIINSFYNHPFHGDLRCDEDSILNELFDITT